MYNSLKRSITEADEIIMNVSFIRDSGIKLIIDDLRKAKEKGKKIRILTSEYMKITEPNALYRLIDVGGVRIFNSSKISFHPKAYIFRKGDSVEVYIGSSNISRSALISGIEWNYHLVNMENEEIKEVIGEFLELYENNSFELSLEWLRGYEKRYRKNEYSKVFDSDDEVEIKDIEPIKFQIPALYELSKTREEGYKKAMVVVGTGLGKTYLSVFDSMNFKRVLFIAHRDEILRGAKRSFETVYKKSRSYVFFNKDEKDNLKDIVFASIFTLSRDEYLKEEWFSKDSFDYIVVDEFHHSSSKSYLKVLEYFEPKFLLGLTATPDRADNGDIYKLCDYNIAYECDFRVGINNGWLVPFEYFGIYDDTDYSLIPWRSGKYDLSALENALIVEKRVELVFKKYIEYRKKFTVGFCASVKHCEIMNEYFKRHRVKSELIIGATPIPKRQEIIERFKKGEIDVIFTVDIFNEGVDIPCIDTLLFLRPTSSYTIFIQQLGRGLRTFEGKDKLRVLDFVGNYKGAELKPLFLTGEYKKGKKTINVQDKEFILPEGCRAEFNFNLIEYFESFKRKNIRQEEIVKEDYRSLMDTLGKIPTLMDTYTFGEIPIHMYIKTFKSWYNFQKEMGVLDENQKRYSSRAIDFLSLLETTSMTKSYKMGLFLSLFEDLSRSKNLKEIGEYFKKFYESAEHKKDLNNKKHMDLEKWSSKKYEKLVEDNPIKYLTENGKNQEFFTYEDQNYTLNLELYEEIEENEKLLEEIRERIEYRIKNYFRRKYMED